MGSSRREGDKTEITQQQVRRFDGAREKRHQSVHMMLAESESASELSHILGNGVACVPTTSLHDNISIEAGNHEFLRKHDSCHWSTWRAFKSKEPYTGYVRY